MPKPESTRSGWPSRTVVAVWGTVLWTLVVVIPTLFLGKLTFGSNGDDKLLMWGVVLLPALILFISVWRRHLMGALCLFPATVLFAIMWAPEITGPRIYGLWQFLTVVIVGAIYFRSALALQQPFTPALFGKQTQAPTRPRPPLAWAHLLLSATLLLGCVILGVIVVPTPSEAGADENTHAAITILLLGLLTWLVALFAFQVPAWRNHRKRRHGASSAFSVELRELWREMRPHRGGLATAVGLLLMAFLLVGIARWL